ncbi:hypothetical protein [Falsibacillus albus]|nr:hypothetical protein [Falsibacillus albus]
MSDNKFVVLLMMTIIGTIMTTIYSAIIISKNNAILEQTNKPEEKK